MPAPNNYSQVDPLRYLVSGVNDADRRNTSLENSRGVSGWITCELVNDYEASDVDDTSPPQYRLHFASHELEFRGHIDGLGANSGDVAFYLVRPFWPPKLKTYVTDVQVSLTTFTTCRVVISPIDGAVTLTIAD